jgi:nicotinate phosphoribosyltransferase
VVALADERMTGAPLLVKVMAQGKLCYHLPSLKQIRDTAVVNLGRLPQKYKQLNDAAVYPVQLSQALSQLVERLKQKIRETELSVT